MPVHRLLSDWWHQDAPKSSLKVRGYREDLYAACLDEIRIKGQHGISYDPGADMRVKWAAQWLEVAEGVRKRVDCGVEAAAEMLLDPLPRAFSGKELAAGMAHD